MFAVVTPSNQSGDVNSYAMYGRIVTVHHQNPFASYPMHFEGDPMRRRVGQLWQRTPDIYGLGFTVLMAALAPVIGQSSFLVHFAYQLVALARSARCCGCCGGGPAIPRCSRSSGCIRSSRSAS